MQLLDVLTPEDKRTIESYLSIYTRGADLNADIVCETWNKTKRTLFKALGRKLRVSIPVKLDLTEAQYVRELSNIYAPLSYTNSYDEGQHPFIKAISTFIVRKYGTYSDTMEVAKRLFRYSNVKDGVNKGVLHFEDLDFELPKGMKIMRAIRKFLIAMEFPNMNLFEWWRNDISNLNTASKISGNLVLSIHPIDLLTLSHNSCGWTSCYNIATDGVYSKALMELVNSNIVLTAYMESKKPFSVVGHNIPNKSWRILMYCHKDIIVTGKPYPYLNEELAKLALDTLRDLVKQNLGWKYQYGPQLYNDMKGLDAERGDCVSDLCWTSHSIGFYTDSIYNDLFEDRYTEYWCYRNYVPKTKMINVSGPRTCIKCGERCIDKTFFCSSTCSTWCKECHNYTDVRIYTVLGLDYFSAVDYKCYTYMLELCEDCLLEKYFFVPEKNAFVNKSREFFIKKLKERGMQVIPVERKHFAA